jgi:hypothetical protein
MHLRSLDREHALEGGFVVLALSFVAGLGLLLVGRLTGGVRRGQRHAEGAPPPGSVPAERHQQYASSPR